MSAPFCANCGTSLALHASPENNCPGFVRSLPRPSRHAVVKRHLEVAAAELRAMVLESTGLAQADASFWADSLERDAKRIAFDAEVAAALEKVTQ